MKTITHSLLVLTLTTSAAIEFANATIPNNEFLVTTRLGHGTELGRAGLARAIEKSPYFRASGASVAQANDQTLNNLIAVARAKKVNEYFDYGAPRNVKFWYGVPIANVLVAIGDLSQGNTPLGDATFWLKMPAKGKSQYAYVQCQTYTNPAGYMKVDECITKQSLNKAVSGADVQWPGNILLGSINYYNEDNELVSLSYTPIYFRSSTGETSYLPTRGNPVRVTSALVSEYK